MKTFWLAALMLVGCATPPAHDPVGTWWSPTWMHWYELDIRADGTARRTRGSDDIGSEQTADGTWSLDGDVLHVDLSDPGVDDVHGEFVTWQGFELFAFERGATSRERHGPPAGTLHRKEDAEHVLEAASR